MDADIAGATNALELAKIKAQDYRNEVNGKYAAATKLASDVTAGYNGLDNAELNDFKRSLMLAAFSQYMTPNASVTLPESIAKDAAADAARAKAGYDAFCLAFGIV